MALMPYKQLAPSGKSRAYPDHRKNSKKAASAKTRRVFFVSPNPSSVMRRKKAGAQGLGTGSVSLSRCKFQVLPPVEHR
jgi:hypothetical protein